MASKKRKADEPPPPTASNPTPDADSSFRPWPDLPQDILLSIRDRVSHSIPDLLAFSSVCRSWRSAAAAAAVAAPFAGPPLLLVPSATPSRRGAPRCRWSGPPECRLKALTVTTRSYRSAISSKTLKKKCVGCSNGHLIFVGYKRCVLADVFTGREIHPPKFPASESRFADVILTGPLSATACLLIVSFNSALNKFSNILCWKLGTDDWSKLELNHYASLGIMTIGVFKDRIFVMDSLYHLIEVEFFPRPSWTYVQAKPGRLPQHYRVGRNLVECGEEFLLVCFDPKNLCIEVYRLDWSGCVWVKMECLGDWCLFFDNGMKFAVACHDPRRWGGRDNCIYFTLSGSDTWVDVPLGGRLTDEWSFPRRVLEWHSPVWVYPSKLL